MVAARERPLAAAAYVGFGPGMFAMVSRELVGASKAPRALLPRTFVRLFAWIEGEYEGDKIRNQVCMLFAWKWIDMENRGGGKIRNQKSHQKGER